MFSGLIYHFTGCKPGFELLALPELICGRTSDSGFVNQSFVRLNLLEPLFYKACSVEPFLFNRCFRLLIVFFLGRI
jgi:hypothetical protein